MLEASVLEALMVVRVASPFVGQVLAVGEERQGRLYTVMPFYRGETLADRLKKNGFISLRQGLKIAVQLTRAVVALHRRSEEHTSELQSLMRNSYAVFCLQKNTTSS